MCNWNDSHTTSMLLSYLYHQPITYTFYLFPCYLPCRSFSTVLGVWHTEFHYT